MILQLMNDFIYVYIEEIQGAYMQAFLRGMLTVASVELQFFWVKLALNNTCCILMVASTLTNL